MSNSACDGAFVSEEMAYIYDREAWLTRSYPSPSLETRKRQARQDVVVAALLTVAETCGSEERASYFVGQYRAKTEAERIAADHGFGPDRLIAMRGLVRSRGLPLEEVLRAALRGDLRRIVVKPAVPVEQRPK